MKNETLREFYDNNPEVIAEIQERVSTWHPMSDVAHELWRQARRQYLMKLCEEQQP